MFSSSFAAPGYAPVLPVLTAPTASGKTALALRLAQEFGLEIVAADAFTVYRGLDIGTAKPTREERAAVPHHLTDVADVTQPYDVAQYAAQAEAAIAGVLARGHLPLVVGGTGFYLSALSRGLPLTPPSDPRARAAVEAELRERGLEALLADIERICPAEATRMERNPRRVVRALEVWRATGRFPGEFGYSAPAFRYQVFAFSPPADELSSRVRERTAAMLRAGWPQEAQWLAERVPPPQEPSEQVQQHVQQQPRPTVWQALGYAEALAVARGRLSLPDAEAAIALATRQYGKRQLTWLRRQLGAEVLGPQQAEQALRSFLSAGRT